MFIGVHPTLTRSLGVLTLSPQDVFAILTQPASQMQAAINSLPFPPGLLIDKDRIASTDWSWRSRARSNLATTLASNTTAADVSWTGYSGTNNRVVYALAQQAGFYVEAPYTGDGSTSYKGVPHGLGIKPGMVIVKRLDAPGNWFVWHRGNGTSNYYNLMLNSTNAASSAFDLDASGSYFDAIGVGGQSANINGASYIAYLFAHDPSPSGIIQCGSFTTDANGAATVALGWSPQWFLVKATNITQNWFLVDTARGWGAGSDAFLFPNLSTGEAASGLGAPTATGVAVDGLSANVNYVFMAIRAPI